MGSDFLKYKEGDIVLMKIVKTAILPDSEEYYIIEDSLGSKFLMEFKHYVKYNFLIGQEITCRVDKINCSGNMFFEPEHPYYQTDCNYNFKVIKKAQIKNSAASNVNVLVVNDIFQNEILVQEGLHSTAKVGDLINCKVDRIKKGKLFLSSVESEIVRLEKGKLYSFKIISKEIDSIGEEYYQIKGPFGSIHKLSAKYYYNYNFNVGSTIQCKVEKYVSDIEYLLEPVHPYYEIGNYYEFEFVEIRLEKKRYSEEREVLIVKDVFGVEARVYFQDSDSNAHIRKGEFIKCKVLKFINGSAVLSVKQDVPN